MGLVETREQVTENIRVLYDALNKDTRDTAIDILCKGLVFVVDIIDNKLYIAPSKFIGYIGQRISDRGRGHGSYTKARQMKLGYQLLVKEGDNKELYKALMDIRSRMVDTFGRKLSNASISFLIAPGITIEQVLTLKTF